MILTEELETRLLETKAKLRQAVPRKHFSVYVSEPIFHKELEVQKLFGMKIVVTEYAKKDEFYVMIRDRFNK